MSKGFGELKTIIPGEGFWVNVNPDQQGNLTLTPPVIAGTVSYPSANTLGKIALAKAVGLFASSGAVEMPPQPGATVTVYDATDTGQTDPLATTTTDSSGGYSFTEESFNDPATTEIEQPPTVPVVVSAEFQSPIDKKNKVKVKALVDPTDKGGAPINPLTTAIGDKVMSFIKDTFNIAITKEIMGAAKPFIDLIAGQVEAQGLTNFKEDDLVVEKYADENWQTKIEYTPPANPNLANTMLDAATGGLFTGMEDALINKGFKDSDNKPIVVDQGTKQDNLERLLASLGFAVQTKTEAGVDAILLFIPSPWEINEANLPGVTMFGDRAFRLLTVADLTASALQKLSNYPVFLHAVKEAVKNASTLSAEAVTAIGTAIEAGKTTTVAGVAAVLADQFQWQTKAVQVVNGVPIFSDVPQAPSTGATVSATELIAAVSGKLGGSPEEVAKTIASQPHNIMRLADKILNQKFNLIMANGEMSDKKQGVADFTQAIKDFGDLKEMVQESDLFQQEVQAIAHRIYAALEPDLYGQVLTAATELKVKSALMLTMILIDRDYLIDSDAGWFTIKGSEGQAWIEPNFANRKWLAPKVDGPGVPSAVLGQLLASPIVDGANFVSLHDAFQKAAQAIVDTNSGVNIMPGDGTMGGIVGDKVTQTTVSGQVSDASGQAWAGKEITIEPNDGTDGTKTEIKTTTGNDGSFSLAGLPTDSAYDMHFAGNEFVFPFFADPFSVQLDLGKIFLPPTEAMGGAKGFPTVSLWVDQTFFNFNDPQDASNGKPQGVDFSNFNSDKPFIVFEGDPNGTIDLRWTMEGVKTSGTAKIAALGGLNWQVEKLNDDALLKHTFTPAELAGEAAFTLDSQSGTLAFGDGVPGALLPEGDHGVYVVKDNGGQYFFIEVRHWEKSDAGLPNGILDLGFAKLGTGGQIELPKETFIGGPTPDPGMGEGGMGKTVVELHPGDVYDLDGNGWSAPQTEPFGYDALATTNRDIVWLADFYVKYWQENIDPDVRKAALVNSDRALSVTTGATLSTVTINKGSVPPFIVSPVTGGVVTGVTPGDIFQVETATGTYILRAKSVEADNLELTILPKAKLFDANGALLPGLGVDQDGDGIPAAFDDNDFAGNDSNPGDFTIVDADGDGVSAKLDEDDSDPNVPNNGGQPGVIDMAQKMATLCVNCHKDKENYKGDIKCDNSVWLEHAPAPGEQGGGHGGL